MKIRSTLFLAAALFSVVLQAQDKSLKSGIYKFRDMKAVKSASDKQPPMVKGSTTMLADLDITASSLGPGRKSMAETYPDIEQLVIIKSGKLQATLGSESKTVGTGSIVYCVSGDKLLLENPDQATATYFVLKFKAKPTSVERKQKSQGSFIVDWNETTFKPHERGGRRDIFDRATNLFERFEMHVTTLNEGLSSHDPHKHNAEEIILLRKGAAEMLIAGENMPMQTWDVAFLDSQVFHGITKGGQGEREYYAFQWEVTK